MIELGTLLALIWPLLVVAQVPSLANHVMRAWASRVWNRLDRELPDDLPLTAGAWLQERLRVLHSPYTAIVSTKTSDQCDPSQRLIVLRADTYFKADPVYWAIAAHELGHARAHTERSRWTRFVRATQILRGHLLAAGAGFALGGVLYDLALARDLALYAFAAGVGATAFKLVDELVASGFAMQELRRTDRELLGARRLGAARGALAAAFITYLAAFLVELALLAWWPLGDLRITYTPSLLTGFGTVVAVVASAFTIGRALAPLIVRYVPRFAIVVLDLAAKRPLLAVAMVLVSEIAPLVFAVLAWDRMTTPAEQWIAMLAFTVVGAWWQLGLIAPLRWPARKVEGFIDTFEKGVDPTDEYTGARLAGRRLIDAGDARLAKPTETTTPETWATRLTAWLRIAWKLAAVPIIVAFWLG